MLEFFGAGPSGALWPFQETPVQAWSAMRGLDGSAVWRSYRADDGEKAEKGWYQLSSDLRFGCGNLALGSKYAANGTQPVYNYVMEYEPSRPFPNPLGTTAFILVKNPKDSTSPVHTDDRSAV